jgi:membrane protein implicated in regulation of membrane protease activity
MLPTGMLIAGLIQAVVIVGVATSSTSITAAYIGGGFLLINTILTIVLSTNMQRWTERREKRRRDRERAKRRQQRHRD